MSDQSKLERWVVGSFDTEETRELMNKKRSLDRSKIVKGKMIVEMYFECHRSVLTVVFFKDSVFQFAGKKLFQLHDDTNYYLDWANSSYRVEV